MRKFYSRFAAAFGTIVLFLIALAYAVGKPINLGIDGLLVTIGISLLYAIIFKGASTPSTSQQPENNNDRIWELEEKIRQLYFENKMMRNGRYPR